MGISETFAERLKSLRGKLSQTAFARLLGIENPPTYQRYEKGRIPDAEILCRIASQFGVSVDWLLGVSQEKTTPMVVREGQAHYGAAMNLQEIVTQLSKITGRSEDDVRKKISELITEGL